MTTCPTCQKETSNPKFCSRSCAAVFTNKASPKRKRTRKCSNEGCEKLTRSWNSSVCQEHWEEYKQSRFDLEGKTIGDYRQKLSVRNRHVSSLHVHIRNFARNRLKHLVVSPCFNCGYDKHVELCHIKALASFDDSELISVVNAESNVMPLCRNCHWEFDNKLLEYLPEKWRTWLDSNKH